MTYQEELAERLLGYAEYPEDYDEDDDFYDLYYPAWDNPEPLNFEDD